MISERAKKILSDYKNKVELWSSKEEEKYERDIEHCLEMLRPYFDAHAKDSKSKLKFPEGTLGFYKTPRSIKLDEKIILQEFENAVTENEFLKMELDKYIKATPSLDKALLKKEGEIDEETGVFKIKGVPLMGAVITPEKNNFTVR
jgi:hypothetical protein